MAPQLPKPARSLGLAFLGILVLIGLAHLRPTGPEGSEEPASASLTQASTDDPLGGTLQESAERLAAAYEALRR